MPWKKQQLLILTKTYPSPSRANSEITCTAALTPEGELWRIFPIPYRCLKREQQFSNWDWIEAPTIKAPHDDRPESHQILYDEIEIISKGSNSEEEWADRIARVEPHIVSNFEELDARHSRSGESLGFIRPSSFLGLEIQRETEPEWTEEQLELLRNTELCTTEEGKNRTLLEKPPFRFHLYYECQSAHGTTEHCQKVTDWKMDETYWHFLAKYGEDEWKAQLRERFKIEFARKQLHLLIGNLKNAPKQWMIVGLFCSPH